MSDQKQTKENETMNAAQVLVRCLENEGVEYVFGIPGEENLEVMRALKDSKIKFITVRHEQGAAFMADVYGKLKGKAGVCLATLGPGATNLVTGVADANTDGAPLIAITGQVGTERMHLTSHQYLDLVTMFTPITKRSKQVVNPDTVNEVVRIAFKYAESEKPGACHIDLPCNIAAMPVESEVGRQPLKHHKPNLEMASIESLEEAAGLLFQAKRPVILAGHSAIRNKASKALTEFAEKLHIPVINTMMAKGIIPCDNLYSLWTIGIPQKDYQNIAIEEADLVIAELPLFSGIQYRAVCFVVFLIITNIYLVRYALKIRKNPELSPMYDLDSQNEQKDLDIDSFGTMDVRKTLIIIALVAALAGMVVGSVKFGWDMPELASVFVGLGIVVGFIAGETPSNMSKVFVEGCKKMLTAAMIIGLASAIASIMSAGKIVDTVVYALASCLRHTPSFFMAPAMYIANTLINFVIVSGSGQAAAIMPIMIPVSDLLGVTRQTSVLAYNFGDGFCNYILPHSTALMGIISAVNIPYDRWLKFIWKLFLIWAVTACIMTAIAQGIHLGPM